MLNDVLILGAGLSGLKIARDLQAGGRRYVRVLDKARGVGGRAATRRWDGAPVDHGAQFFTVRDPVFRAQTNRWMAHRVCFPWAEGFHQWDPEGGLCAPEGDSEGKVHPRYACHEGMSALGKDLANGLRADAVQLGARVTRLRRHAGYWQAEVEGTPADDAINRGKVLVSTLPTPQLLDLLAASELPDETFNPGVVDQLRAVEYAPTLAVLLRGTAPKTPWQGIQLHGDRVLGWIGADTDKRSGGVPENGGTQVFVLHGSADFSQEWQDRDLEAAADLMVSRAGEIVGPWITRLPDRQVHRWRYASVPQGVERWHGLQLSRPGDPPFYVAGDAFLGAKIEGAYLSGREVAKSILAAK